MIQYCSHLLVIYICIRTYRNMYGAWNSHYTSFWVWVGLWTFWLLGRDAVLKWEVHCYVGIAGSFHFTNVCLWWLLLVGVFAVLTTLLTADTIGFLSDFFAWIITTRHCFAAFNYWSLRAVEDYEMRVGRLKKQWFKRQYWWWWGKGRWRWGEREGSYAYLYSLFIFIFWLHVIFGFIGGDDITIVAGCQRFLRRKFRIWDHFVLGWILWHILRWGRGKWGYAVMNFCSREEMGTISLLEAWDEFDVPIALKCEIYENMLWWWAGRTSSYPGGQGFQEEINPFFEVAANVTSWKEEVYDEYLEGRGNLFREWTREYLRRWCYVPKNFRERLVVTTSLVVPAEEYQDGYIFERQQDVGIWDKAYHARYYPMFFDLYYYNWVGWAQLWLYGWTRWMVRGLWWGSPRRVMWVQHKLRFRWVWAMGEIDIIRI